MDGVDLSVAINIIEKKIADLNMKIIEEANPDLENELEKLLKIKKEIYKGDKSLIKEIIDDVKKRK